MALSVSQEGREQSRELPVTRLTRTPKSDLTSHRYFKTVCPGYKQRVYTLKSETNPNGELDLQTNGQGRIHQLQVMLAGSDANCIRIDGSVFDDKYAGPRSGVDCKQDAS